MDLEFYKIKLYKSKRTQEISGKSQKKPPKNLDYVVQGNA